LIVLSPHPETLAGSSGEVAGWPVGLVEQFATCTRIADALIAAVAAVESDDDARIATLALPSFAAFSFFQADVAVAVARDAALATRTEPAAAYFADVNTATPEAMDVRSVLAMGSPSWLTAREVVRSASWTPWWRMPKTLFAPEAVAISHNALLRSCARSRAVRFRHASGLLPSVESASSSLPDGLNNLRDRLVEALTQTLDLPDRLLKRLRAVLARQAGFDLGRAKVDLDRLRDVKLPRHIWAGTGGFWPTRAIGLEVLRREGQVTRFDHAAGLGLRRHEKWAMQLELSPSSRFVVGTRAAARRLNTAGLKAPVGKERACEIVGATGDPTYSVAAALPVAPGRRRVLYGSAPVLGQRRVYPPIYPDHLGLDWQIRLARLLKKLPIELMLRPHPEGLFRGRPHPLSEIQACETDPYETLMGRADILLFDYAQTTTFTVALCTDRPIVFLDSGLRIFADDIEEMIDQRCRRVRVLHDDMNRPQVDPDELAQALADSFAPIDPKPFRDLLWGRPG
jgi:hypothetical protein